MSPAEVGHRLRERARIARLDPDAAPPLELAQRPTYDVAGIARLYAATSHGAAEAEATVRARRLRLLGRPWSLDAPTWFVDPDGRAWDDAPWTHLAYRNAGVDPKFMWEAHRLLYLLPIAAVRRDAEDPEAGAALIRDVLADWGRSTRPHHGIAWTSGIEVALRLLALTILAADDSLRLPEPTLDRIRAECSHGLEHLERFPSRYSSANNHRVAELVGILVVGRAWGLPARPDAEAELAVVARTLFGEDGAPLEQSSTYGAVTLELLALAHGFAPWHDTGARDRVGRILDQGAGFLAAFVEPGLGILRYGDDDEWRILGTGLSEATWLECLSALLGRPLGPAQPGLQVFPDGGQSVVRTTDGATATFDHGPLGFGALAAHGHLDQLHVSLYADGVAWLVDPGTFEYHRSDEWRTYFRAADHHNGPRVEGDPICVPTGPFNWAARRPVTTLVEAEATASGARLAATSRSGTHPAHLTRRDLEIAAGRLVLRDSGPSGAALVSCFVVHPECRVETIDSSRVRLTHPRSATTVEVRTTAGRLAVEPQGAWVSTGYAVKHPAASLTARSARPGEPLALEMSWRRTSDQGVA